MKLTDFARKVEVDYTLLRNAEGGKKRFTLRNAIRIANAYGFEVSDVLCNSKEEAQEILRTYEHPLDPMACRSLIAGIILQSINDYTLYKNIRPEIEDFFNSKYFATIYDHKKGADFIKLCKKERVHIIANEVFAFMVPERRDTFRDVFKNYFIGQ